MSKSKDLFMETRDGVELKPSLFYSQSNFVISESLIDTFESELNLISEHLSNDLSDKSQTYSHLTKSIIARLKGLDRLLLEEKTKPVMSIAEYEHKIYLLTKRLNEE